MKDYKHAVGPALNKELTMMFVTYKAFVLIDRFEVPSDATFFRFFCFLKNKFLPDHSFERMSARLCAMEVTPLLMLRPRMPLPEITTSSIQGGFKDKVEFMRYDVPAAFLQRLLPTPCYGLLPPDLPEPCVRISNKIFDEDHTQLLLSLGYVQFEGDLRGSRSNQGRPPTGLLQWMPGTRTNLVH